MPLTNIFTASLAIAVIFGAIHARDVISSTVVPAGFLSTAVLSAVTEPSHELKIHQDLHNHVERTAFSQVLNNVQNDKPLTDRRSLKKVLELPGNTYPNTRRDGTFGVYIPRA